MRCYRINGTKNGRAHKRPRLSPHIPSTEETQDITDLWWQAVRSDTLIGNGIPTIRYASSRPSTSRSHKTSKTLSKPNARKRKQIKKSTPPLPPQSNPQSLLTIMNTNLRTMRRVRRTHAKFAALNANMNNDEDVYVPPPEALGGDVADDAVDEQPWVPQGSGIEVGAENAAGCIHWMSRKVLEHSGFQGRLF